jgi:hypothetical protein
MKKQANIFKREYWSYTKQNIIDHVTQLKQQREYLLSICFIEFELLSSKFKKERGYRWLLVREMKLGGSQIKGGKLKCELHIEEEALHIRRQQHHDKQQKVSVLGAYIQN